MLAEVGDINVFLSTTDVITGGPPLQLVTVKGASDEIKVILAPKSNNNSTTNNNPLSIAVLQADNDRKLQSQLKESQEQTQKVQQDLDKKCADYINLKDTL